MDFQPEFSRPVLVDTIPTRGMDMEIEASAAECAALAERFAINKVAGLKAKAHLRALAGGTLFKVDGHIRAVVEQTCVVTLEPVEQVIDESFMITFGAGEESDTMELDLSMDDDDPPEPLTDGAIDLGEVVAEHLALALDPFPRKAGAGLPEIKEDAPIKEEKASPFAALAAFKQKNS
ncbi:DUF177 domain-containing protein [Magnetospirillum sp. 64-120]|uniref:DUF177 domain-containing protein n=1 Tax=Magnetospirillum sp. 64-120 TaxID=1895778 RepID=UPI00092CE1E8|nr:DUF177 domain-containing protein [Magnetospirillum sp. 64-120]OJX81031.1 MAG: hypothetical protein BGO92_08100 [Magnetospirillum sp. 64-120]